MHEVNWGGLEGLECHFSTTPNALAFMGFAIYLCCINSLMSLKGNYCAAVFQ